MLPFQDYLVSVANGIGGTSSLLLFGNVTHMTHGLLFL